MTQLAQVRREGLHDVHARGEPGRRNISRRSFSESTPRSKYVRRRNHKNSVQWGRA
jgi:hypothetical protein